MFSDVVLLDMSNNTITGTIISTSLDPSASIAINVDSGTLNKVLIELDYGES